MVVYIVDSYAWIEYFIGSAKGEVLKTLILDKTSRFITVECCLAEIKGWALRNNRQFDQLFKAIRANSTIAAVIEHDWINAAQDRFEQRKTRKHFGLIDAVLLVKQREFNCMILSGDEHFKGLNGVKYLF